MVTLPGDFNFPNAQQNMPGANSVFNMVQAMSGMGGNNMLGGGLSNSIGQLMNPGGAAPIGGGVPPGGTVLPPMPKIPKAPVVEPRGPKPPIVDPAQTKPTGQFTMDEHGFLVAPAGMRTPAVGGMRIKPMVPAATFNKMTPSEQQQAIAGAADKLNMQRSSHR